MKFRKKMLIVLMLMLIFLCAILAYRTMSNSSPVSCRVTFYMDNSINSEYCLILNIDNTIYVPLQTFYADMGWKVIASNNNNRKQFDLYPQGKFFNFNESIHESTSDGQLIDLNYHIENYENTTRTYSTSQIIFQNDNAFIPLKLFSELTSANISYQKPYPGYSDLPNIQIVGDFNVIRELPSIIPPGYNSIATTTAWEQSPNRHGGAQMFLHGDLGIASSWTLFDSPYSDGYSGHIYFYSLSEQNIQLMPLALELRIYKVIKKQKTLVASYRAPSIEGEIAAMYFYTIQIPDWDLKDLDGKNITPGTYIVELVHPENFEYYIEGNLELQQFPIKKSSFVIEELQILNN